MGAAVSTVMVDNDQVRVTQWQFGSGDSTGWHRHGFDYVIIPIIGGPVEIVGPEGARSQVVMEPGASYFRDAGVEHDVIYRGDDTLCFVEVELKSRPG